MLSKYFSCTHLSYVIKQIDLKESWLHQSLAMERRKSHPWSQTPNTNAGRISFIWKLSQNRVFTSWTSMTLTGYSNYGWIDSDTPKWAWFAWRVEVSLSWRTWALPAGGHGSTSTQMSFWSVCPTIGQASARKERMVGWEVDGQMARQRLQWQVAVSFVWDLDEDLQNPTHLQLQPFLKKRPIIFINYTWV